MSVYMPDPTQSEWCSLGSGLLWQTNVLQGAHNDLTGPLEMPPPFASSWADRVGDGGGGGLGGTCRLGRQLCLDSPYHSPRNELEGGEVPPKERWAIARVHKRQAVQKRRKKFGSSVAYKTRGTVLSQR